MHRHIKLTTFSLIAVFFLCSSGAFAASLQFLREENGIKYYMGFDGRLLETRTQKGMLPNAPDYDW